MSTQHDELRPESIPFYPEPRYDAAPFPVGCRVLHKIDGCEGVVFALQVPAADAEPQRRPGRYTHPVVVKWDEEAPDTSDEFRADFSCYRHAELLRI